MKYESGNRRSRWGGFAGRQLTALVLVLGMIMALPLFGSAAIDLDGKCSLTVTLSGDEEYAKDLEGADVVFDLYLIATAEKADNYDTYGYNLSAPYGGLAIAENLDSDGWRDLSRRAAKIALESGTPVLQNIPAGSALGVPDEENTLQPGLYLLIARGSDVEDYYGTITDDSGKDSIVTKAYSSMYEYSFFPELVSLPGKAGDTDNDGNVTTADDPGEWVYDMKVTLKPERKERFGSLEIEKILDTFYEDGGTALFVFDVEAVSNGETVYSNVVTLAFDAPGVKKALAEKIPVGAAVTVTEVYSGASYELVSQDGQTAVIAADTTASVSFENDFGERQNHGSGITNHFTYVEGEGAGWEWTQLTDNSVN